MNIKIADAVDGKFQSTISKTFPLTGSGSASEVIKPKFLLPRTLVHGTFSLNKGI